MRIKIAVLLQCVLLCTHSVSAINIEMVTVGNPGNSPDNRYNLEIRPEGYGAVNYVYEIGKYEITNAQYTEFLNAVAKADPSHLWAGFDGVRLTIQRSGASPNFSYSVAPDFADLPVIYVDFWDAIRFCNWLHNGQPTGPQGLGTTEDGAYHDVQSRNLYGRNPGAKYFLPSEDEWYKAAYHNKGAGLAASYFDYPTETNTPPGNDPTETTNPGNNANFLNGVSEAGTLYYPTIVGEFELSQSPYGTFDQGGNVWEWHERNASGHNQRGGSFLSITANTMRASYWSSYNEVTTNHNIGFRIAAAAPVPEPTCISLFSSVAAMVGVRRGRRQRS